MLPKAKVLIENPRSKEHRGIQANIHGAAKEGASFLRRKLSGRPKIDSCLQNN